MFCTQCGKQLEDDTLFCPHCGAAASAKSAPEEETGFQPDLATQPVNQPDFQQQPLAAAPVVTHKRSAKKGVLIGIGCAVLAGLVGCGVWFLSQLNKPAAKLLRAAERTITDLKDYTESLPNLHTIVENADQLSDLQKMHVEMGFEDEYSYEFDGEAATSKVEFSLNLDQDLTAGRFQVTSSINCFKDKPFSILIYGDSEQLQIASDALLDEGEAVSVPVKDFVKSWNESALSELTELTLPEDLENLFDWDADWDTILTNAYGEEWTKVRDSFEVVEHEGTPHFSEDGVTYELKWDRSALHTLAENCEKDSDKPDEIEDLEDLSKLDLDALFAKPIIKLLGGMNDQLGDVQFLVEDGRLTGLYMSGKDSEGLTTWYELRLLGEQNRWEHLQIVVFREHVSYTATETVDVRMTKTDSELRIEGTLDYQDSDGEEYSYTDGPYAVVYSDKDGRITAEEKGEPVEELPALWIVPENGGLSFRMERRTEKEYNAPYDRLIRVNCSITDQIEAIEAISATPIELLKLTQQQLEELANRIEQNAKEYLGYTLNP